MSTFAAIFSSDATTQFVQIACCHEGCGCIFAVPVGIQKRLRNSRERFFCPFGHGQNYTGKNEVEELKDAIERERRTVANLQGDVKWYQKRTAEIYSEKHHVERQLAATKGVVTKIKRRVGRGVCPCCNRRFVALERHMANKHPEYHLAADAAPESQPDGKAGK